MKQNITNSQLEHLISETAKRVMAEKAEAIKGRPLNEGLIRDAKTILDLVIQDLVGGLNELYPLKVRDQKLEGPYKKIKMAHDSIWNVKKMLDQMEKSIC